MSALDGEIIVDPTKVRSPVRVGPVMVKVSPDTAVVIPVAPATLNVSPSVTAVPDESSPTTVNAVAVELAASVIP